VLATDVLRGELGFEGVLLSDDLEMRAIADRYGASDAAVLAVEAGCDALLVCSDEGAQQAAFAALITRAERDPRFRARCEQAHGRVMRLRGAFPPRAAAGADLEAALRVPEDLLNALRGLA
jgi:beta-N-acetylhexosaminidase